MEDVLILFEIIFELILITMIFARMGVGLLIEVRNLIYDIVKKWRSV